MLLLELMSEDDALNRIHSFVDSWQWGDFHRGHGLDDKMHKSMSSLIRRFIPEAIYTGRLFRLVAFNRQEVLKARSVQQLTASIKHYRHANEGQLIPWSKSMEGVASWVTWMGSDLEAMEPGDEHTMLLISQESSQGLEIEKIEQRLIKAGKQESLSRASHVEEVMAPLQPPITPVEFHLIHAGEASYHDDDGYEIAKPNPKKHKATNMERSSSWHVADFKRMQTFIKSISKHSLNEPPTNRREGRFGSHMDDAYDDDF